MASPKRPNAGTKGVARPEREQQIIAAACQIFGERGYAAASVADIAEAAGISKPLIYNYFGSKDGLHVACLRHASEAITEEIERTARTPTVGAVRAIVTLDGMFRLLEPQPWLWRLVFDPTAPAGVTGSPELMENQQRITEFGREGVAALMLLADNDDARDIAAMHAVWESAFRTLVTWWLDNPGDSPEQMTQRCVRLFQATFGNVELEL